METLVQTKEQIVVRIPLEKINPDPEQPRRTITEIQEMADSIKGIGRVIQAIGVITIESGYRIIYGERRFEGSKLAGLKDIPAVVYDNVSSEEIKVIQIVENAQREDLNQMEQAIAFQELHKNSHKSFEEIAALTGKSIYFIRQNIKLNSLISQWQKMVRLNAIPLKQALQISQLDPSAQLEIYKDNVDKEQEKSLTPIIDIQSHEIERYRGYLANASFDINDVSLCPKAGACTGCPFNSAFASLFPSEAVYPRCNNIACFENKSSLHLEREINKCKEDSATPFIYKGYGEFKKAKALKAEGYQTFQAGYNEECKLIDIPVILDESQYVLKATKNGISKSKAKAQYKIDLPLHEKAKIEFDKKVAAGKYIKALMVEDHSGNNEGQYVYIELTPKESKSKKIDTKKADITPEDIRSEIARIKDWEKRKKEKDEEHIQNAIAKAFKEYDKMESLPIKPLPCNSIVVNHLIIDMLPWNVKGDVLGKLKIPNLHAPKNLEAYVTALTKINSVQITFLLRHIFLEKYTQNLPDSKGGYLLRLIAEQMNCFPIKEIKAAQAEKAKKRMNSMKTRIAILEEQEANLVKQQKNKPIKSNVKKVSTAFKVKPSKKAA